ncbi:MAG TPA: hypothetical protein VM076_20570 [Gemmatimonadaceae bacterium]|nr:hypothetical protein [Gemmatimonadaceae bacterium]
MTETQQRFLRAIAERVSRDQVVEVHLFPAIRQGGVETGVAVVAEDPRPHFVAQADGAETVVDAIEVEEVVDTVEAIEVVEDTDVIDATVDESETTDEVKLESDESAEPEPQADGDGIGEEEVPPPSLPRFIIHTARYRLTLKGVDRGKWEVDVVAEADAPLDALDKVIRGVQRRAGEGAEPDRLTSEAFREALDAPLATLER